jgi:DNA-binding CsgD family transcriptional regulator
MQEKNSSVLVQTAQMKKCYATEKDMPIIIRRCMLAGFFWTTSQEEVNSLNSCILDAQFESSEEVTGRDTLLSALQSRDTTDMAILSADMAAILSQRQLTVLKHILAGYSTAEIERAGIAARMTITRTRRRVLRILSGKLKTASTS